MLAAARVDMLADLLHRLAHRFRLNAVVLEEVWLAGEWPGAGDILWLRCMACRRLYPIGP